MLRILLGVAEGVRVESGVLVAGEVAPLLFE
jgi:hypothetical protein